MYVLEGNGGYLGGHTLSTIMGGKEAVLIELACIFLSAEKGLHVANRPGIRLR